MNTVESRGTAEQNHGSAGLFQKFRGLFGGGHRPADAPLPTAAREPAASLPAEQNVVAPAGYHVQAPAESQPTDDIGQMLEPVREGLNLLPPLSQVVTELLREIQSDTSSAASVGEIVSSDPALAAALIRAVNSAAFGLKRRIASVSEAVSYLGLGIVKSMVVRLRLGEALTPSTPEAAQDIEDLWIHSLAVSYAADCLAHRVPGVDRGFLSTLGLLHDVGKLAVTARLPGQAQAMRDLIAQNPTIDQRQLEAAVLGVDHASLGGDLAARWQLPADLVEAIRWHHRPADALDPAEALAFDKIVGVLKIANQLAKYCYPYADHMQIDAVEDRTFDMLGLEHSLYKLLDEPMRQAISRAIFFVEDKSLASAGETPPRRFLRPLRGEGALAAATAGKPAGRVVVNDAVIEAIFASTDGLHQKSRSSAGDVEKGLSAAVDHLKEMGLASSTHSVASATLRYFLPNLVAINTPFDEIQFAQQRRGDQLVMAFRTPGLAARRRLARDPTPEEVVRLAEADFGNVLNLGWFSKIAISSSGDAVILLSK